MTDPDEIRHQLEHLALALEAHRGEVVRIEELIGKEFRKVVRTPGISVREAAEITGVSKSRAYQIVNGTR